AFARFLEPIPKSEQLRALLGRREFSTQYYDEETRRDFWVGSDGSVVVCVTIADIGLEDAARVRLLQQQRSQECGGKFVLSHETVALLVSEALGGTIRLAN
ncbi:MAG: hypothetical protein JO208_03075, partial [Alphaproteobacteria bacterium]|nr:hypothetical protein [Alphaproteobacteria bacterium]